MLRGELDEESDTSMIIADGGINICVCKFFAFSKSNFSVKHASQKLGAPMKESGNRKRAARKVGRSHAVGVLLCVTLLFCGARGDASIALLVGEPYGTLGGMSPTGHAAIYLNRVCAETPTRLRMCRPGELGAVVSRYSGITGYDWIAIPLVPYLYAVDDLSEAPPSVDQADVAMLRDAYRREHLRMLVPDGKGEKAPDGRWIELIGASYDRTIHVFEAQTTREQDEHFVEEYNDRRNVSHFNYLLNNCADFSRNVLNFYFPHAIHKNYIADVGLMTPKQDARALMKYGKKHPELKLTTYVIPQVPGSMKRSTPVNGVVEALVKSKRYVVPLAILHPEVTGGLVVVYLSNGRFNPSKNAQPFKIVATNDAAKSGADDVVGANVVAGVETTVPTMADPSSAQGTDGVSIGVGFPESLPAGNVSLTSFSETH
jgi:hypothetical protein